MQCKIFNFIICMLYVTFYIRVYEWRGNIKFLFIIRNSQTQHYHQSSCYNHRSKYLHHHQQHTTTTIRVHLSYQKRVFSSKILHETSDSIYRKTSDKFIMSIGKEFLHNTEFIGLLNILLYVCVYIYTRIYICLAKCCILS